MSPLAPLLLVLSLSLQHATASLPQPPRQQLETPYSHEAQSSSSEAAHKRANLKELLTYQLQRANDERSNAFTGRRPALVAPQPPPERRNAAVLRSKARYVSADEQLLSADSNESDSPSAEIENANANDVTALPADQSDEAPSQNTDLDLSSETELESDSESNSAQDSVEDENVYDPYRDNFYDLNADGSYVFGYSLPNGVRRYERGIKTSRTQGLVVEGFYAQPRQLPHGVFYELRCYRSDANGHRQFAAELLRRPPRVQRDEVPDVDCLNR